MKIIDGMLHLELLTPGQYQQIGAWNVPSDSPDAINSYDKGYNNNSNH